MALHHRAGHAHQALQFGMGEDDPAVGPAQHLGRRRQAVVPEEEAWLRRHEGVTPSVKNDAGNVAPRVERSEEHTSELQSLMRISYAVFCLKKKINVRDNTQCDEVQR